jgi:hypothetical protein
VSAAVVTTTRFTPNHSRHTSHHPKVASGKLGIMSSIYKIARMTRHPGGFLIQKGKLSVFQESFLQFRRQFVSSDKDGTL